MDDNTLRHSLDTACDVDIQELLMACQVNVQALDLLPSELNVQDLQLESTDVDISALLADDILEYSTGDDWLDMDGELLIDTYSSDESTDPIDVTSDSLDHSTINQGPTEASEKATIYLAKIHSMLEQCPPVVAAWTNGGSSFAIYNCTALEKTMLPLFFKPIKFESFARQLNSYGFKKTKLLASRTIVYEFSHPRFVRGQLDQLQTIKRRRRRMQRLSAHGVEGMTDGEFRASFGDMVRFVQTLHEEVAEMKNLVKSLVESSQNGNLAAP